MFGAGGAVLGMRGCWWQRTRVWRAGRRSGRVPCPAHASGAVAARRCVWSALCTQAPTSVAGVGSRTPPNRRAFCAASADVRDKAAAGDVRAAAHRVLVLGGYGTFGSLLCRRLADSEHAITVLVGGRNMGKAAALASELGCEVGPAVDTTWDVAAIAQAIVNARADTVVHTCGPFTTHSGYNVAEACVTAGAHYIDLADNREFVGGIERAVGASARDAGVVVVSGASTVPAITCAVLDAHAHRFDALREVDVAICPGGRGPRGVGTVASVLEYAGSRVPVLEGGRSDGAWWGWMHPQVVWQHGLAARRLLAIVDVPDLDVLPRRYPTLQHLAVRAGVDSWPLMLGIMAAAWLRRVGLVRSWVGAARGLLAATDWLFDLGSDTGALTVSMRGSPPKPAEEWPDRLASSPSPGTVAGLCGVTAPEPASTTQGVGGQDGDATVEVVWELHAANNDGPQIPVTPATLVVEKLARGALNLQAVAGARPCIDLFTLDELMESLAPYHMQAVTNGLGGDAAARERQRHARQAALASKEADDSAMPAQRSAPAEGVLGNQWFQGAGASTRNRAVVPPPTMARCFGEQLRAGLPPAMVAFHESGGVARGRLQVDRGANLLSRAVGWLLGLPQAGASVPLTVTSERAPDADGSLTWTREFAPDGGRPVVMHSVWDRVGGLAKETLQGGMARIGMHLQPVAFPQPAATGDEERAAWMHATHVAIETAQRGLGASGGAIEPGVDARLVTGFAHAQRRMWCFGLPVPRFAAPTAVGVSLPHSDGLGWWVDVWVTLPLVGPLVSYQGHVRVCDHNARQ